RDLHDAGHARLARAEQRMRNTMWPNPARTPSSRFDVSRYHRHSHRSSSPCFVCYEITELAATVQQRGDATARRRSGVGNRLLLGEYLDEHVRKHVCILDAGPVLRVGHELAVLGRAVEDRVDPGTQAEHRGVI